MAGDHKLEEITYFCGRHGISRIKKDKIMKSGFHYYCIYCNRVIEKRKNRSKGKLRNLEQFSIYVKNNFI